MLRNGIQDMVVVVNNRRCLKGADSRSKSSPEFVSIDEESQHETMHVFCLGKHPLEGFCQEAILLTEHRDTEAALRLLKKALHRHGVPATMTIAGSDAHAAAIQRYNAGHGTAIAIRQVKYVNTVVEQARRGVQRVPRPMVGGKSFPAAQDMLVGIALMHMIKHRQLGVEEGDEGRTAAARFYSLAA